MMDKLSKFAEENDLPQPPDEEWTPPEGPDPQWEAAVRGNTEALHKEIDPLSSRLKILSVELQSLAQGLKEHVSTQYTDLEGTEWIRSGSLRVPASPRTERDNPPTKVE